MYYQGSIERITALPSVNINHYIIVENFVNFNELVSTQSQYITVEYK